MLENTFGTVVQSMLQLARAQDQMNRYLQQHLQQGQMNIKCIQELFNNWQHLHTNEILIIFSIVYKSTMEVIEKVSFHGWND